MPGAGASSQGGGEAGGVQGDAWGWASGGCVRLQDDVEAGLGERAGQVVAGGLPGVVDRGELLDQALLHREDRVGFYVPAARHEDVRGEGPVAGGSHDEVDVRRAVRVPSGGV